MLKFHAFVHVGHLPRADKSLEQVGTLLDHLDSDDRAPRVSQGENFILVQMVLGDLDSILGHAVDGSCVRHGKTRRLDRLARTPLVPLHDGGSLLPRDKEHRQWQRRYSRAAMKTQ